MFYLTDMVCHNVWHGAAAPDDHLLGVAEAPARAWRATHVYPLESVRQHSIVDIQTPNVANLMFERTEYAM
jgi:hypothetical protein